MSEGTLRGHRRGLWGLGVVGSMVGHSRELEMLQWVSGRLLGITEGNYRAVRITGGNWGHHRTELQRLWGLQGGREGPRRGMQGLGGWV